MWLACFLHHNKEGPLVRIFHVKSYFSSYQRMRIGTDASPFGLGGWIELDGVILGYFSDEVQQDDIQRFKIKIGEPESQQILECLAALVAMRLWLPLWRQDRISLTVRR